jgi:hypothetical protein
LALAACRAGNGQSATPVPPSDGADVRQQVCQSRVNDTAAKLEQCITRAWLWRRLTHFQTIADENPGTLGHPNRDTGTPGYAASAAYVAGLMQRAGYAVTVQKYPYRKVELLGTPLLRTASRSYTFGQDWFVARQSADGAVTAAVEAPRGSGTGCSTRDFAGFTRGNVAVIERGACSFDAQVANARAAGAGAVVLAGDTPGEDAYQARLVDPAGIPVAGVVTSADRRSLLQRQPSGAPQIAHVEIRSRAKSRVDYNVIADSPYGDAGHTVAIDAHLDSIFGAGMLDNASGSTTILEIALNLAHTPTRNRLRYIWFGGEELGLLGSRYYTAHLTKSELAKLAFDVDVDVTATPNFDILIADPKFATKAREFPPNVTPESKIGNEYFAQFFRSGGVVSRPARFGNDGTDSLSFAFAGVPNSGVLTEQDCCKHTWETKLWGGFLGNYEGNVPGDDGGCVDRPNRWCDNLSNNDPFVFELVSRAVAYVTFELANRKRFPRTR